MSGTKRKSTLRKILFEGNQRHDALMIGNYGDVHITAKGKFDLSGMLYLKNHTVQFVILGDGVVKFHGCCKHLVIKIAKGNCMLDFRGLICGAVKCMEVKGDSVVFIGRTLRIEQAHVKENAKIRYTGKPLIMNYSIGGDGTLASYNDLSERSHPS
jgi:hypothetical protein